MSAKECVQLTAKGSSQNYNIAGGFFTISDQLFDSTSSASSSNGTTSTSDTPDIFSKTRSHVDPQAGSPSYSSPLAALHSVDSCPLQPPSNLHHADNCKLSPPLRLHRMKPSSSPPPLFKYSQKVEHNNGAVKRSMGLMKLRRQGRHPSATSSTICHGSFNQAAAARELMASLERLSMKEKTMGMNAEREREVQRALLGAGEGEESLNAAASRRNGLKLAELPLTTKIAAAMDAEGLIGVQEEITLQCENYRSRALRSMSDHQCSTPPSTACKTMLHSGKSRPGAGGRAAASSDEEVRSNTLPKMHCKRRRRWIILRRLRSSRALFGKLWIKLKRVFSSSSTKHLQNQRLKVNN